jgi:Carboxypeptidase regulatory-like domain
MARDDLAAGDVNGGSSRWLSLATLTLLVACGGGGGATGTTPLGDGSGTTPFGSGAGTPPFGTGSGTGGGLTGDGPRPTADPAVVVSDDAIQGSVINSRTGIPLAGASVKFGGTTLTTNSDGAYGQQSAIPSSRVLFEVSAANYETLYIPAEVLGTVPSVGLQRLTPFGTTADVTVASGGTVTDTASTAAVTLPPNALVPTGGGAAPTTVGVRVTQIAVATDSHLLSGDYTDDNANPLETFGSVTLSPTAPVDVASGQTLTLNIPVSSRGATPATANLYRFDPGSGRWAQAGTATLAGGVYTATVGAFGQWMVGASIASPVTITGCVNDDAGAPAANVRVEAEGISYSSIAQATSNAQGQFTVTGRPSSRLLVSGRRGAFLTNAASVDVGAVSSFNLTTCLTLPSSNAATMRLTWGASPTDIDSHLRTPDGSHVFYSSKGSLTTGPFASLDVDDVTGFGPEVTTIRRPRVGIYRFYLHNFSQSFTPGMTGSPTRVELNYVGRTVVFSPPPGEGSALYWHLFDLSIAPNCTMTLYRYNRWRADEPQNPNASTTTSAATECVPS